MLARRIIEKLKNNKANYLDRSLYSVDSYDNNRLTINNQSLINFASNDYLGVARDEKIKQALIEGAQLYGFGSGSSAIISGYSRQHQLLEETFAEFLDRDKAILFNSGYHANIGTISALANKDSKIIMDRLCHASIIDGVKLSGGKYSRYNHNDSRDAEEFLATTTGNSLLISEGVFSMEGDLAPLQDLSKIAKKHHSTLIVDDAHGIGVLGEHGGGVCEYYALKQSDVPCLVVPLGKAFGAQGAIVAGNKKLIEHLRQFARSYTYSTSLPPIVPYTCLKALNIIQKEGWRRERLQELIQFFIHHARRIELPLISEDLTPIKSLIIGCNIKVIAIQKTLMELGFFISAIRSPTVPVNLSRIRFSINCMHTEAEIKNLLELVVKEYDK